MKAGFNSFWGDFLGGHWFQDEHSMGVGGRRVGIGAGLEEDKTYAIVYP